MCLRLCGPGTSSSRGTWELVRKAESGFAANKTPGVQSQSGSDTTQIAALFPHHPPSAEPLLCPHIYTRGLRFLSGLQSAFRPHLLCAVSPQTKENLTLSRAPCGSYPATIRPSVCLSGTAAPPSPFRPLMAERFTLLSLCPTRRYHENSHTTYDLQTGLQANTLCATHVHLLVLGAFGASDVPSTALHSRWTADTSALPPGLTSVPKITSP